MKNSLKLAPLFPVAVALGCHSVLAALVEAAPQTFWPGGSGIYYRGAPLGISFRNFSTIQRGCFCPPPCSLAFLGFCTWVSFGGNGNGDGDGDDGAIGFDA